MSFLTRFLDTPTTDPDDGRRRRLLNVLLAGMAALSMLVILATTAAAFVGLGRERVFPLYRGSLTMLIAVAVAFAVNRYWSGRVASSLFLLLLTLIAAFTDEPQQVVDGRTLFVFAIPILMASALLHPWASFLMAGLVSLLLVIVALSVGLMPNLVAILAFFALAFVSWLSARSLQGAEDRARRRLQGQVAVNRLALALGEARDLDVLYHAIYDHIRGLMDASSLIVSFYEGETQLIHAGYMISDGNVVDVSGFPPIPLEPPGHGTQSRVIRTGRPLYVPDWRVAMARTRTEYKVATEDGSVSEGPPPEEAREESTNSAILAPMQIAGRTVGVMQVQSRRLDAYTQEDVDLIAALANVAAVAIHRARAEAEIRRLKEFNEGIVQNASEGIILEDADGYLTFVNPAAAAMLGYAPEELVGRHWTVAVPPDQHPIVQAADERRLRGEADRYELEMARRDGNRLSVLVSGSPFYQNGRFVGTLAVLTDLTERKRLEEQLRQAQRMEAIGALAGGVAHDFNNLLTIILSYANLVLADSSPDDPLRQDIEQIRRAGGQASDLTRQLLAFSRQQVLQPRVLDLNDVVRRAEKMLRRLVGEDVELVTALGPNLGRVKADPGQIEQVIMNLVANARDAMPRGGRLTIETANAELDEDDTRLYAGAEPGPYVMLAVSDTGVGMDAETQAHIFEPFFTTKEEGKGTGLGLATVYGIVTQSGGHIQVCSEPEQGTTFKVYLPRVVGPRAEEVQQTPIPVDALQGTETVLVVEDEKEIRNLMRRALTPCGYTVLDTGSPGEAIRLCERHPGSIHLLITDVVMPEMTGPDLARQLLKLRPEMKVLYVSGYPQRVIARHGVLRPGVAFLGKPFTPDMLAHKARQVLNTPR